MLARCLVARSSLSVLCLSAFLAMFTSHSFAQNSDKTKELEKLKRTIQELRKELESTKSNRDEVNQALEKTEKNINDLSKKARKIEGQLEEREDKLEELRDERSELNTKKLQQESHVGSYINAAYRLGQQGNLRLLLNQEDPARVSRNLKYYNYFANARAEKISEYMSTIERINAIEPEIAYQADMIQQDLASLRQQRKKLQGAQDERRVVLAKLNARISTQDQKLRSLREDRRQLEKLLSKVIENVADIKLGTNEKFSSLKGRLPWPTKGRVLRRFGANRVSNKLRWEGVLIGSNPGDPVKAVHYGRVVFSDYLRGHGLLIIVDHGGGFLSLYAHNQALYKELGEWVESGEQIASVGNSGGQKDTALYFELRYKGKPTNPQRWFKRA